MAENSSYGAISDLIRVQKAESCLNQLKPWDTKQLQAQVKLETYIFKTGVLN